MQQDKVTDNQITTQFAKDKLTINFEGREQRLSAPSRVVNHTAVDILFGCLSVAFISALVTQIVLTVGMGGLTIMQLVNVFLGLALFFVGLEWAVKQKIDPNTAVYVLAAVAGLVLGAL